MTRALVLELAEQLGIDAVEADRPVDALAAADEAFLSSTTREVQAIAHVDGIALPARAGTGHRRASPTRSPRSSPSTSDP